MKVTSTKVNLSKKEGPVKAFVSVGFDNELIVHDLRVIETVSGLVVAMPTKKAGEQHLDTVHPANAEFRSYLTSEVLAAYISKKSEAPKDTTEESAEA